MELTDANLNALFTSFNVKFQEGFEVPPSYYDKICSVTRSASTQTQYPWMGRTTKFRHWLGDRELQNLTAHAYTIVNENFEDTVGIDRNAVEDDTYGVYSPVIQQLGWDTKVHPDTLVFGLIMNAIQNIDVTLSTSPNAVPCYDGNTFFSASHPVGLKNAGVQTPTSNVNSSGGNSPYWYLIDAGRPIRPFIFQMRRDYVVTRMNTVTDEHVFTKREFRYGVDSRCNAGVGLWQLCYASNADLSNPANYAAARAAMRQFKTDAGLPFGALSSRPSDIYLLVPPVLEEAATTLMNASIMVGTGASSGVTTSNIWRASATLLVSEYLS